LPAASLLAIQSLAPLGWELRSEPGSGADESASVALNIAVRNNGSADVHLIVPPELGRLHHEPPCFRGRVQ